MRLHAEHYLLEGLMFYLIVFVCKFVNVIPGFCKIIILSNCPPWIFTLREVRATIDWGTITSAFEKTHRKYIYWWELWQFVKLQIGYLHPEPDTVGCAQCIVSQTFCDLDTMSIRIIIDKSIYITTNPRQPTAAKWALTDPLNDNS